MSIATYAELKASAATWLHRTDLAPMIPDFITLFEAFANRVLRIRAMERAATVTMVDGVGDLPADFLEAIAFGNDERNLNYLTDLQSTGADPGGYSFNGLTIRTTTGTAGATVLRYYAKFALGPDDAATNWLLANAPDAYLFGTLTEAAPYIADDPRIMVWQGKRDNALGSVQAKDDDAKFSGQTLSIAAPYNTRSTSRGY